MIIWIHEPLVSKLYMKFTEITDRQRDMIEPLLPKPATTGRPRGNDRTVLNGIICVPVSGCGWSEMPKTCVMTQLPIQGQEDGRSLAYGKRFWDVQSNPHTDREKSACKKHRLIHRQFPPKKGRRDRI